MDSQIEDCEHVVAGCKVSRLLWALVLTQWAAHVDAQEWTRELTAHQTTSTLTNQARRALILGQRPAGQQQHPQAFALLRGLVLASLIDHRNECAVANKDQAHTRKPPQEEASRLYGKVRRAFNHAIVCDLRHAQASEQYYHVRGRPLPPTSPTRQWRDTWEETGFAERVHGNPKQKLLPEAPSIQQHPTRNPTPPPQLPPTTRIIYTDGSSDEARKKRKPHDPPPKAGWGFVALQNGDGGADDHAQEVYKAWGPVVTHTNDAYHIGAERTTNNTAELSALAHALAWALKCDPNRTEPLLIRYDSTYAANVMTGKWQPHANKTLARRVNKLWREASKKLGGQLWCTHVRAHHNNKWNEEADKLANGGRLHGRGAQGTDLRGSAQNAPT